MKIFEISLNKPPPSPPPPPPPPSKKRCFCRLPEGYRCHRTHSSGHFEESINFILPAIHEILKIMQFNHF